MVVHSMDRLARNLDDLRRIVQQLTRHGARIEFVKEPLVFTRMPPLQRRSQDIWVVVHPGADGGPLVGTGRGLTHCSGSAAQMGIDIRTSTARSAGPFLFSRLKASNSNINGSASCERGGRLQAVPQASSRPCPAHRSRL